MEFSPNRSSEWALDKAIKLMDSASRNPFQKVVYRSHLINLQMYRVTFSVPGTPFGIGKSNCVFG